MSITLNKYTVSKEEGEFFAQRSRSTAKRDLSKDGLILEMYNKLEEQDSIIKELQG